MTPSTIDVLSKLLSKNNVFGACVVVVVIGGIVVVVVVVVVGRSVVVVVVCLFPIFIYLNIDLLLMQHTSAINTHHI